MLDEQMGSQEIDSYSNQKSLKDKDNEQNLLNLIMRNIPDRIIELNIKYTGENEDIQNFKNIFEHIKEARTTRQNNVTNKQFKNIDVFCLAGNLLRLDTQEKFRAMMESDPKSKILFENLMICCRWSYEILSHKTSRIRRMILEYLENQKNDYREHLIKKARKKDRESQTANTNERFRTCLIDFLKNQCERGEIIPPMKIYSCKKIARMGCQECAAKDSEITRLNEYVQILQQEKEDLGRDLNYLIQNQRPLGIHRSDELYDGYLQYVPQRNSFSNHTSGDPYAFSDQSFPNNGNFSNFHIGPINESQNSSSNVRHLYLNESSLLRQSRLLYESSQKDHPSAPYSRNSSSVGYFQQGHPSLRGSRDDFQRPSLFPSSSQYHQFKNYRHSAQNFSNSVGGYPASHANQSGNSQNFPNPTGSHGSRGNPSYSHNYSYLSESYNRSSNPNSNTQNPPPGMDYEEPVLEVPGYPKGYAPGSKDLHYNVPHRHAPTGSNFASYHHEMGYGSPYQNFSDFPYHTQAQHIPNLHSSQAPSGERLGEGKGFGRLEQESPFLPPQHPPSTQGQNQSTPQYQGQSQNLGQMQSEGQLLSQTEAQNQVPQQQQPSVVPEQPQHQSQTPVQSQTQPQSLQQQPLLLPTNIFSGSSSSTLSITKNSADRQDKQGSVSLVTRGEESPLKIEDITNIAAKEEYNHLRDVFTKITECQKPHEEMVRDLQEYRFKISQLLSEKRAQLKVEGQKLNQSCSRYFLILLTLTELSIFIDQKEETADFIELAENYFSPEDFDMQYLLAFYQFRLRAMLKQNQYDEIQQEMLRLVQLMEERKDQTEYVVLIINIIKLHVIYQKLHKMKYPFAKGQDYWVKFFEKNLFNLAQIREIKIKQDVLIVANYFYRIEKYAFALDLLENLLEQVIPHQSTRDLETKIQVAYIYQRIADAAFKEREKQTKHDRITEKYQRALDQWDSCFQDKSRPFLQLKQIQIQNRILEALQEQPSQASQRDQEILRSQISQKICSLFSAQVDRARVLDFIEVMDDKYQDIYLNEINQSGFLRYPPFASNLLQGDSTQQQITSMYREFFKESIDTSIYVHNKICIKNYFLYTIKQ